jgi:preprotein translocase subunit SecE
VARDRKRAKQRRARRGRGDASTTPVGRSSVGNSVRADVPGALDHASGDVDEFDAALVRGAGGVPAEAAPADVDDISTDPERLSEGEIEAEAENEGDLTEDEIQELAGPSGPGGGRTGGGSRSGGGGSDDGGGGGGVSPEQASGAPVRGNRAIGFLRASWAELQRVQWPDRRQVFQATAVVLGFVAIAGAYLGLADYVAKEIVEFIL